ncbi:AsmA family protein [Rhodovibrio salinarum]|uniref:AsmA family protein n=1 Tax=Rhodovibrio salinarum TaxID=1087 RepID=A0A934QKA7_9PROT|nr:AsmA family protein [Rhodovibrio salinarum]MBK1698478.1 AsmA family protein [Rhodovibrio salinarum]
MKRLKWIAGSLVVLIVAVLVAGYVALASLDLESYRGELEQRAETALGRELKLTGAMSLSMGLSPGVQIDGVEIANTDWGSRPQMVTVERFEVEIGLLTLLTGELQIRRLVLIEPDILLEVGPDGQGNWAFGETGAQQDAASSQEATQVPDIASVRIEDGTVRYQEQRTGLQLTWNLATASLETAGDGLSVRAEGSYQSVPFQADGTLGALSTLMAGKGRYPFDLKVTTEDAEIALAGALDQSGQDVTSDAEVQARTNSLANLTALSGLPDLELPDIGPASLQSRVRKTDSGYRLSGLNVGLGESDLAGEATLDVSGDRMRVTADLTSSTLDLRPFTAGVESTGGGSNPDRVFPDTPLPFDLLRRADADLTLKVGVVKLSNDFDAQELRLSARARDGRLELAPLQAKLADGAADLSATLDARASPPELSLDLDIAKLDYGRVLRDLKISDGVDGKVDVRADLTGRGETPHAIAGSLNGGLEIVGDKGRFDNALLDTTGAGLRDLLAVWREQDQDMNLNCAVARFGAEDGVLNSRALLADTQSVSFGGTGDIDLGEERIDLRVTPKAKQTSLMSLAVPVRVSGPLLDPSVGPDPLGAAKATAFVVGAAVNPLAALGALVVSSEFQDENPCVAALAKARQGGTGEAEEGNGGVGGFLENMGESLDDALGGGANGDTDSGSDGNRFLNRQNDR